VVTSTRDQLSPLVELGSTRVTEPNGVLWHEGTEARSVGIVLSGVAFVTRFDPVGSVDTPTGVAGPGQVIGHDALVDGRRTSTVSARTPLRVCVIHVSALLDLMQRTPRAALTFTNLLVHQALVAEGAAAASRDPIVEGRVVRWLAHLADQLGKGAEHPVIPLSQIDLAQLCATRRPTLNVVLRSLVHSGAIDVSRSRIVVRDAEALLSRYGERSTRLAS
jgi:CRP-like cAMP-binding protein